MSRGVLKSLLSQRKGTATEEHWIPLADLMTGLMLVFMLVAIVFMVQVEREKSVLAQQKQIAEKNRESAEQKEDKMRRLADAYQDIRRRLYNDLRSEFRSDLRKWGASLDEDLTIRFEEPEILFDIGKFDIKPQFKIILTDFFPRYVRIISSDVYKENIEEVRIEGHTSSVWSSSVVGDEAYIRNMELSQSRTRSTLQYVLGLPSVGNQKPWLVARLTANGLSSSRLRLNADGGENVAASQRVEFRVRTNAERRIADILQVDR